MKAVLRFLGMATAVLFFASTSWAQLLPAYGGERAGASALSFLKNDLNVRSVGMAGANVSLSGDGYSWLNNPAAMSDVRNTTVAFSNGFVGVGVQHQYAAASWAQKKDITTLGIMANVLETGAFEERTEFQPQGTGRLLYGTHAALGVGIGKRLTEQFSLGVVLKGVHETVGDYRNTTAAVDLGFLYRTDVKGVQFAVAIRNFGGSSALSGTYLTSLFNRTPVGSLNKNTLPTEFCMGISGNAWQNGSRMLRVAVQLNHPNDNAENYRLGCEYSHNDRLIVRTGVALTVAGKTWPALGFSTKGRMGPIPFWIDFASTPTAYTGMASVLGLRFSLHSVQK